MWPLHLGYMDAPLPFDNSPGGTQINLGLKRKGPCESFGEKFTSTALLGSGRSMGMDANGEPLECAFNMFVLDPISVIVYLCFADRTYNLLTYDQRSAP
jgi:hypothetical protein